jgi:hypothetical protein
MSQEHAPDPSQGFLIARFNFLPTTEGDMQLMALPD